MSIANVVFNQLTQKIESEINWNELVLESEYNDLLVTIEAGKYSLLVQHHTDIDSVEDGYVANVNIKSVDIFNESGRTILICALFSNEALEDIKSVIAKAACERELQNAADSYIDQKIADYVALQEREL
jgi:hypothetical protein